MPAESSHDRVSKRRSAAMTLLYIVFGPLVWALHLLAIYGPQALLCARGVPGGVPIVVAIATLLSILPLAFALYAPGALARGMAASGWPETQQRFIERLMLTLSVLALFAVAAAGATVLVLPACSALR
jgi:hypothetical protein